MSPALVRAHQASPRSGFGCCDLVLALTGGLPDNAMKRGPAFAQRLAELLPCIAVNDREIEYINGHTLPSGGGRPLVAKLVARGLEGFVKNAVQTPRITEELRLPAFGQRGYV